MSSGAEQVERMRVAWVDTDAGGRIHFSNAFRWAEVAETSLMRRVGMLDGWGDFPRKHVEAEFHQVLRFDDELEVRLRVERVGTTSITYAWTIERGGEVARAAKASASSLLAPSCFTFESGITTFTQVTPTPPVPDAIATTLARSGMPRPCS